jgi:hypothetical protein
MGSNSAAVERKAANFADSGVGRHLANPLGIGGGKVTSFLTDPLGLFDSGKGKLSPTKRARLDEQARQAKMAEGTDRVNAVFDSPERAAQLEQFLQALRENFRLDADRQKQIADRKLRFSMARGGLTGGSAAVDANRTLGEEYTKGVLGAESRAQEAQGRLKSQDEASRLGLISMIRSGLDATTAAQRAGAAMQQNAQTTSANAMTSGLGDIFGSTAGIYKQQQEAAERRRGEYLAGAAVEIGVVGAQGLDLPLEVFSGGERPVDRRESQVGDLVQLPQRPQDRQANLVGGHLG